jgi:predicted dehydrogenase
MIRFGIIGTGIIAREHVSAALQTNNEWKLAAVADLDTTRLSAFAEEFKVAHRHMSAEDLIANPEVDLVVVATPPAFHESAVVAALEAGKRVLCEKPLAHTLAAAKRIEAVAARFPGKLSVSYQLRYASQSQRMIWLAKNGLLGNLQSALIERHGYIPHTNLGAGGWWGKWNVAGGGVLMTQLIHEVDLLLQIFGEPESVTAIADTRYTKIESEDYLDATVRFAGGARTRMVASVNSGRFSGRLLIRGEHGVAALPWELSGMTAARLQEIGKAVDTALPATKAASRSILARGLRLVGRRLGFAPKPELSPHALLYLEISRCIQSGLPMPVSATDAIRSLELCTAIYEAAITGTEIKLPLSPACGVVKGVTTEKYAARFINEPNLPLSQPLAVLKSPVRIGLIGLDTTHATSFAKILHDSEDPFHIPGAHISAAYPGSSADMGISSSRVGGFTAELRDKWRVPILDTPEDVANSSDIVCILSSDGRTHRALFEAVATAGKPVFMDKPFALTPKDAQAIMSSAQSHGIKVFGSSAFRYADGLVNALLQIRRSGERIESCQVRFWLQIQETQGRYFWYGIHAAEMLLACMGAGLDKIEATQGASEDIIQVTHKDGRKSEMIGSLNDGSFSVRIQTDQRSLFVDLGGSMGALSSRILRALLDVLTDGQFPPLWRATPAGSVSGSRAANVLDPDHTETLEVIGLLDAAQRSLATGSPISLT